MVFADDLKVFQIGLPGCFDILQGLRAVEECFAQLRVTVQQVDGRAVADEFIRLGPPLEGVRKLLGDNPQDRDASDERPEALAVGQVELHTFTSLTGPFLKLWFEELRSEHDAGQVFRGHGFDQPVGVDAGRAALLEGQGGAAPFRELGGAAPFRELGAFNQAHSRIHGGCCQGRHIG